MKKIKLLIPALSVSVLAGISMPLTSCKNGGSKDGITPKISVEHGKVTYTTIKLNTEFTITYKPDTSYELATVTITIGDKTLTEGMDYTISGNTITVEADAVTSKSITITITASSTGGGSATKVITTDTTLTEGTFESTKSDSNVVLVNGKDITVDLSNLTLNKTGKCSKTEDSSFYGTNSALLAKGGSSVTLDNLNVTTNAVGANGVFAYGGKSSTKSGETGDGTHISISNSTINTTLGNSGGVMVAGHGSLTATKCTVTTQGDSSAAIRSDRGGDTMLITEGTYTSNGKGSPAIYATAAITATGATLKSTTSEGVILEGSNSVTLTSCNLEDTNCKHNSDKSSEYKNIFLYQSQSGDAGSGHDYFTATDCTITTHQGDDIYVTNQTSTINLTHNTFTNDWEPTTTVTQNPYFLRCKADGWGKSGENGGHATLNASNQTINGNIDIDSISTLKLYLKDGSKFTGALTNQNESYTGVVVNIDSTSSWKLTADSYIGSLDNSTTLPQIDVNGHILYGWDTSKSEWKILKQ